MRSSRRTVGRCRWRALAALFLLIAARATAAAAAADDVGRGEGFVGGGDVIRILLTLGLVVVLIFVLAWLLRRTGSLGNSGGSIRVLAGASVGQRERVVLLGVGERQFLVGVAPGSVRLIERFDEPVVEPSESGPVASDFAARLRGALERQRGRR